MTPDPFPHMIIESAVPPGLLMAAYAHWPHETDSCWHRYPSGKLATRGPMDSIGQPFCAALHAMATHPRIADGVFPDWTLNGAGLHTMGLGVSLGRHLDPDHHPVKGYRRRYSAILFANACEGGTLVLHGTPEKRIDPAFNRMVVFECSDRSFHSVEAVRDGEARKSLALFFCDLEEGERKRPQAEFDMMVDT